MSVAIPLTPPILDALPKTTRLDSAIDLDCDEAIPMLHASRSVQARIEDLLNRQRRSPLSDSEDAELEAYAELDDCLSFLNRVIRNLQESA
ncbi:MAG: hypothetical protein HY328_14615 [Chloroflexi bacterium]|nr:hypothetical protein [Chloroflexota bacterium]